MRVYEMQESVPVKGAWFLDTSALTKRYVRETGTDWMVRLFESSSPGTLGIARLALLEMRSLLMLAEEQRRLAREQVSSVWATFEREAENLLLVQNYEEQDWDRALEYVEKYALRPGDALQLAAAAAWREKRPEIETVVVCSDSALQNAAREENFAVIDPVEQPTGA